MSAPALSPDAPAVSVDSLKAQGNAAFAGGRHAEAILCYTRAIELDGLNHVLYSNRAAAFLARAGPGDALAAISDANASMRLSPGFAKAYHRKGCALMAIGELEDAVAVLQAGVRVEPANTALREALQQAGSALSTRRMRTAIAEQQRQQRAGEAAAAVEAEAAAAPTLADSLAEFEAELAALTSGSSAAAVAREAAEAAAAEDTWETAAAAAIASSSSAPPAAAAGAGGGDDGSDDGDANGGAGGAEAAAAAAKRDPSEALTPAARVAQSAALAAADLGTGAAAVERLLGRHATWLNLNPYEVLRLPHTATLEDIHSRFRRLAALVHPDKHPGDTARATAAFDIVRAAHDELSAPARREVAAATVAAALKAARREWRATSRAGGQAAAQMPPLHEAEERAVRRAFAEREARRRNYEARIKAQAEREAMEEVAETERMLAEHRAEQEWAKGRDARMESWQRHAGTKRKLAPGETHLSDALRFGAAAGGGAASTAAPDYKRRWR